LRGTYQVSFPIVRFAERFVYNTVVLGWIFVIAGVAAEAIFEGYVSSADGLLQRFNDIVLNETRKDAADAELATESLRRENLRLEALIQPRTITIDVQRKIGDTLRHLSVKRLTLNSFRGDPEAYRFCEQINSALTLAKLDRTDHCGIGAINIGDEKRMGVEIESWQEDMEAAEIARALEATEVAKPVSVNDTKYSSDPMPFLGILVSTKPLPDLK